MLAKRWCFGFLPGVLLGMATVGCESGTRRDGNVAASYNQMRNFASAYLQATSSLKHPPKNADELRPFLQKFGDPDQLLSSPSDKTPLVVCWGVDPSKLARQDNRLAIWAYEQNSQGGKRWALQERSPIELTDEQFKSSLFAPGFK